MWYIRWAWRNLTRGGAKSIRLALFLSLVCGGLFLFLGLFKGTEKQIWRTLRSFEGDVVISSRIKDNDISFLRESLSNCKCASSIKAMVDVFSLPGVLAVGNNSFSSVTLVGLRGEYFSLLDTAIEWKEGKPGDPEKGEVVLEYDLARRLGLHAGDSVMLQWHAKEGSINTARLVVRSIFYGNKYEVWNQIYTSMENVQFLTRQERVSSIRLYLDTASDEVLDTIVSVVSPYQSKVDLGILSRDARTMSDFAAIFDLFHLFFGLFVWMFLIVLLIVLCFGLQNAVFLRFNERKAEISTLVTYGMSGFRLFEVAFWEMALLLVASLVVGWGFACIMGHIIELIPVIQVSSEMVVVVGGPRFVVSWGQNEVILVLCFVVGVLLIATALAVRRYLSREVVQMMGGLYA